MRSNCSGRKSSLKSRSRSATPSKRINFSSKIEARPSEKIPARKRGGIESGIVKDNVVKIYHELTDSFGNPLKTSKTFSLEEKQNKESIKAIKNAPAYLQKNFDEIMQQINSLKAENTELKLRMQYGGLGGD